MLIFSTFLGLSYLLSCNYDPQWDQREESKFRETNVNDNELGLKNTESSSNTASIASQMQTGRDILRQNLLMIQQAGKLIFGQQSFTFMSEDDSGTKNILWQNVPLLQSGSKKLVGDDPGILGVAVHYFSLISHQTAKSQAAKAVKSHLANGGVVAFEWHMRGCFSDDDSEKGMYTNVDQYGSKGAKRENNKCICAIANDWKVKNGQSGVGWLNERVDKFANAVKALGPQYSSRPMIFRPFHEHTGNWFWWHEPFWDCRNFAEAKNTKNLVTGVEAFKKVFRHTVNRIQSNPHGLNNFLIAYSPDKLYVDSWDYRYYPPAGRSNKSKSVAQLKAKYLQALPAEIVDIYGFDIYDPIEMHGEQLAARSVQAVSELAARDGKIAALTETGSYKIDGGKKGWYTNDLLNKTIGSSKIAFAMTWENRSVSYVPVAGRTDRSDFINFYNNDRSLFLKDISGILERPLTFGGDSSGSGTCVDPDGDGWGWDGEKSCQVKQCIDPDGDGWGWDGEKSCQLDSKPSPCVDPDGDGWGWDGEKSCQVNQCIDPDGDGWGWDGEKSCRV